MTLLTAACTPNAQALDAAALAFYLAELSGWVHEQGALQRSFRFDNFREVMDFANAVAEVAEAQDHHPDLILSYSVATLRWSTHSAGHAVTLNDVVCAAQVSALPEARP
ncbi:MAG: 4a-hydroxytetrahydrobiopterin dehydratase [Burkholderiales bacterium]|nr:4a-hydroxytetrahydrobiopterin dehydratase [Burkholderiales bacterium]